MSRSLIIMLLTTGCSEYKLQGEAENSPMSEDRVPEILTTPEEVSVGWVEAGERGEEVVQIMNVGEADLSVTGLQLDGALSWSIITEGMSVLEPGAATTVILEWEALEDVDGTDALAISSSDPVRPQVDVPLSWMLTAPDPMPGELLLTPTTHDFGTVEVGATETQRFMLQNIGEAPLTVTRLMFDGSSTELALVEGAPALPLTLEPGQTEMATVSYTPADGLDDAGSLIAMSDGGDQASSVYGSGKAFEGFSTGWYVWDPRIPVPTTTDPAHLVDHHGDEDTYFYENSGVHGMTDSVDIEGDFAVLRDYVITNAGEPIVPSGPFTWGESSALDAHNEATFTYFLCDFYLPEDADPSAYTVESLGVDDGLRIIVNGHIIGHQKISEGSASWALAHAVPGAVNTLLVILVDDAAVHKSVDSLAFWYDGALVEG